MSFAMHSAVAGTIMWFVFLVALLNLLRVGSLPPWLILTAKILFGIWTAACLYTWCAIWQERQEWKKNKKPS